MATFISALRLARQARGWSLDVMALRVGASSAYLSRAERGLTPLHPTTAVRLARVLGVPLRLLKATGPFDHVDAAQLLPRRRGSGDAA